jgi:hypothetical protein
MTDLEPSSQLLSARLESRLRDELEDGEHPIWTGQPRPWSFARRELTTFLFGIPFLGFALFWEASVLGITGKSTSKQGSMAPLFFRLWGIPFILVGLYLVLTPLRERIKAARTAYVLTDRRALILEGSVLGAYTVRRYSRERLASMSRVQHGSGWGDLVFEEECRIVRGRGGERVVREPRGFLGIREVQQVDRLVRQTLGI